MTSIVVDIGNTSTSVGLAVHRRITRVTRLDGGARDAAQASAVLRRTARARQVDGVMVASVVPRMNARWATAARRTFGRPALFLTHRLNLNVGVDYPQPDRIGADRLANVCGVVERYGAPAIVADFGTAVTFDVVSPERAYIGGVIAPGIPLMLDYLVERTALLPRVPLQGPIGRVGRSTAGAMRIGARIGYRGMTREIVHYLIDGLGWKRVKLVATGGYGRFVAPAAGLRMHYDPDLTLFGLSCVFEGNAGNVGGGSSGVWEYWSVGARKSAPHGRASRTPLASTPTLPHSITPANNGHGREQGGVMDAQMLMGAALGVGVYLVIRCLFTGWYTVDQNQRAVKTVFGRASRVGTLTTLDDPIAETLDSDERERYAFPQVRVIPPGGPYFKWPWEKVHKVSVATETLNMAFDPGTPQANKGGTVLEAVTKDQLNTGLCGQIRFKVCERNLYAYLFGVANPIAHVMGYFVSVLRERIANFEAPRKEGAEALSESASVEGISINDLRKNLRDLNEHMDRECQCSAARYGIVLDASLITSIDPPAEVESALAAINTAHNQVSSDISLARASADQKIVQSRRAVEIETLKAQAEVEPLRRLAAQLAALKINGQGVLEAYVRNVKLALLSGAQRVIREVRA